MKAVMTSAFMMLGIEFLISKKASNVATEELGRLLVDAVEIMLGARPSTCSHIIVGEDFFSSSQDLMESGARLVNQFMAVGVSIIGR